MRFDTITAPPALRRGHSLRAVLVHAWMRLSRRVARGLGRMESYLAQPHGEYHWCRHCADRDD